MVKKKGSKETDKTKHLPKVFSGKKDATKTAVTPKNIPGHNFTGKNAIGRGTDAKGPTNAALSKGVDSKSASIGKGTDLKGTNGKSVLGKGIDSKGSNAALGKGIDPRGLNSKSGLTNSRIANVTKGATPGERLRLRADHRRELFTARLRLPIRPLPGERGFTGVPPVGETRLVSTEMVFRVRPNVSPQTLEAVARRHG